MFWARRDIFACFTLCMCVVAFCRVLLQPTKGIWAMKMLKKAEVVRLQQVEHMLSEKAILSVLDHPFIVQLGGAFHGTDAVPALLFSSSADATLPPLSPLPDRKYLYMLLEYVVGGEFFTHLRKAGRFDNVTSKFYAAQVTMIFDYLHRQDIIYRDLKPENLLLDHQGYIKITDFGFAKRVAFKTYTLCGTPEYIAPEVLLNKVRLCFRFVSTPLPLLALAGVQAALSPPVFVRSPTARVTAKALTTGRWASSFTRCWLASLRLWTTTPWAFTSKFWRASSHSRASSTGPQRTSSRSCSPPTSPSGTAA